MSQKDTRVSINIRPGVLGLASLEENVWHEVVDLTNKLEEWVFGQVLQRKFTLSSVTGVLRGRACQS